MLALALVGCSESVYLQRRVTPDEAARVVRPRIVALERDGRQEKVREAIGVFGSRDDAYILTTSGHVSLEPRDRLIVRGRFSIGEEVPGGGVIGWGIDPGLLATGLFLTTAGTGALICAGAAVYAADHVEPGLFAGLGEVITAMGCLLGGSVALGAGAAFTGAAFHQPGVRNNTFRQRGGR